MARTSHASRTRKATAGVVGATRLHTTGQSNFVATLRKSGGAHIVTVPKDYVRSNELSEGAKLQMKINGRQMLMEPVKSSKRRRPTLAELLANTPTFARVPEWDEAPAVGLELTP